MKRIATFIVTFAFVLAPASALASSSSTCQAYNNETCGPTQVSRPPSSNNQLPFTGLDLVLLVVGGGALLGAGVVVRRVSRNLS
jgi:hypothetical protein